MLAGFSACMRVCRYACGFLGMHADFWVCVRFLAVRAGFSVRMLVIRCACGFLVMHAGFSGMLAGFGGCMWVFGYICRFLAVHEVF